MNTDGSLTAQYQLLRSRIESELRPPAVILVTSARPGDGKSVTAHGLVDCLAKVGHRVVLADASMSPNGFKLTRNINGASRRPIIPLPLDERDTTGLRSSVQSFVREMHDKFDFTIIDGTPFMRSNVSMLLAAAVDGVLITVRLGRALANEDELTSRTLEHAKANVLGVVAVAEDAIALFRSPAVQPMSEARVHTSESIADDVLTAAGAVR